MPNGSQKESPGARDLFRKVVRRHEVVTAYVTGRHPELMRQGLAEFGLPDPDWAIGDVGTSLYRVSGGDWEKNEDWSREIALDFKGWTRDDLEKLLGGMDGLRLQEPEKQNEFKLSYYADPDTDDRSVVRGIEHKLNAKGIDASVIWSVDEAKNRGLLDVIPKRATKLHAIRFLVGLLHLDLASVVFSGDSGNDMEPLTSELNATLVANATEEVRREAVRLSREKGREDVLYLARGGFLGMNGNYAAGVLEGLAHYIPEAVEWMEAGD